MKGCQWVSRRVNRCIASGKGVETRGDLYLDMEVAKGSEMAGTTVTADGEPLDVTEGDGERENLSVFDVQINVHHVGGRNVRPWQG